MKSDNNQDELNYWPSFVDIFSSLFFIFFILFSLFYFNYSKREEADKKDIDDFKSLVNSLNLEFSPETNEIVLPSDLLFEFNKSELRTEYLHKVSQLREELKNYMEKEDRKKRYCIIIEGHTDTVGDEDYNYRLSLARSYSLINEIRKDNFFNSKEIDLIPAAYGESKLNIKTADNTFEKRNRRVVIRIVPKFIGTIDHLWTKSR